MNPNQIPQNPLREFDELYVKDDKVLQADSEQIANEWFKQRDDEHFRKELELLTVELQQLDEGKSSPSTSNPLLTFHALRPDLRQQRWLRSIIYHPSTAPDLLTRALIPIEVAHYICCYCSSPGLALFAQVCIAWEAERSSSHFDVALEITLLLNPLRLRMLSLLNVIVNWPLDCVA